MESLCYIEEELEQSPFTWSEPLIESFASGLKETDFHSKLLKNQWSNEVYMLEKVAKDQVIRGYFSDEETDQSLNFSSLREDLADIDGIKDK